MASPLGRGHPDGCGLRHLRLRFASDILSAAVGSRESHGARQRDWPARPAKCSPRWAPELTILQEKLKALLQRMSIVFETVKTGKLDDLTKAMSAASVEIMTL